MKNLFRIFSVAGVVSVSLVAGGVAEANHAWGDLHWARTANPFTLELGSNLTQSWGNYLTQASTDWSISSVLDTAVVSGNTNAKTGRNTPKNCTPTEGRGEVCNAKYGNNGWLGIASVWSAGGHITAGTVKLNDTYFGTRTYNTPAWKNLVMCQEVGHLFGLGHQDETFNNSNLDTCMDYTNNPASNQHPNAHDYEMLESIYAHLDSFTTVGGVSGATPAEVLQENGNDPKTWGEEVHRSENGNASIFVKDLGNGNRVLRHVYWAEPRGNDHHHD